jgi:hypothetical protein
MVLTEQLTPDVCHGLLTVRMQQSRITNQVIALPVLRVSTPYLKPFQ